MNQTKEAFDQWCIVELLGHVRVAGRVTEEERFGCKMGRIDIPQADGTFATQYFGGGSVYRISPVTEEMARAVAAANRPEPVHRWELPAPRAVDDALDAYGPEDDDEEEQDEDLDPTTGRPIPF